MVEAANNRTLREDYRASIITYTVRKVIGDKNAEVFDEFPEHKKKVGKEKRGTKKAADIRANMRAYKEQKEALGRGEKSGN